MSAPASHGHGAAAPSARQPIAIEDLRSERARRRRTAVSARQFRRRVLSPVHGVFLFQPRSMRRLIQQDVAANILAGNPPPLDYHIISRDSFLLGLEDENPDALQVIEGINLPETLILLPMPPATELATAQPEELFARFWSLRLEAEGARRWQKLHLFPNPNDKEAAAVDNLKFGFPRLTELIGAVAVTEIDSVQRRDLRVLEGATELSVMCSFVGTALRLKLFAPWLRAVFFPAIDDWGAVDELLAAGGIDEAALLEAARPAGITGEPGQLRIQQLSRWRGDGAGGEHEALYALATALATETADPSAKATGAAAAEEVRAPEPTAGQPAAPPAAGEPAAAGAAAAGGAPAAAGAAAAGGAPQETATAGSPATHPAAAAAPAGGTDQNASASTAPGDAAAVRSRRFEHHARLWSRARLWRRRDGSVFDQIAALERRACAQSILGGLAAAAPPQRPFLWDLGATFLGWLKFLLLYTVFGAAARALAGRWTRATVAALTLEGYATRVHWRAARKAAARGNTGEVLRRLHEALWHYRMIEQGLPATGRVGSRAGSLGDEVDRLLGSEAAEQVEKIVALYSSAWKLAPEEITQLRTLVRALGDPTVPGWRGRKGRMLKDVFKACLDLDRTFARIQLVPWFWTRLHRVSALAWRRISRLWSKAPPAPLPALEPLKPSLEYQGELKALRQLRGATKKLAKMPWPARVRARLAEPLVAAQRQTLQHMQHQLRPILEGAIREAGLQPRTPREDLALQKVCDELLDVLERRWHLRFSDLRDAIARNDLRLEDPKGIELLEGDELTRLNSLLAQRMVGIYERAEIYLKALQRGSTLLFATTIGRLATRFLLLPYVGAFLIVEGAAHIFDPISRLFHGPYLHAPHAHHGKPEELLPPLQLPPEPMGPPTPPLPPGPLDSNTALLSTIAIVGTVLLLVIHTERGRFAARWVGRKLWAGLRFLFTAPFRILRYWRPLDVMLRTPAARRLSRWLLQPMLLGAILASPWLVYVLLREPGAVDPRPYLVSTLAFAAGFFLTNSKSGRDVLDSGVYRAGDAWRQTKDTLLLGLFRMIMDLSDQALGLVEQVIYRVDDLLRFRAGESGAAVSIKSVLQVFWSAVTYLTRIYVNLLIEPQVNPIKHFPVVTVTHKLMIPMLGTITTAMMQVFGPILPTYIAWSFVGITVFLLPGLFGFLAWELKENWKLYRANHPRTIRPVVVGSHGETMKTLLQRGFHSGTVAKAYDRLRGSLYHYYAKGAPARREAAEAKLHHCEHDVGEFLERELVASLRQREPLRQGFVRIVPGTVRLATQSMRLSALLARDDSSAPLEVHVHYHLDADLFHAEVELRRATGSGGRTSLNASERQALVEELHAFLQRSAATFDAASIVVALLREPS